MVKYPAWLLASAASMLAIDHARAAQIVVETVRVGNAGNRGELSGDTVPMWGNQFGIGQTRTCGAVDYVYEIGKYEVNDLAVRRIP